MRQLNKASIDLIKEFEGLFLNAYQDPRPNNPIWTIGYGTIRYPNGVAVKKGDKITEAQAEEYLKLDLSSTALAVEKAVKVLLTDNEFGALVSLAYNIGVSAFNSSTLLRKLNEARPDAEVVEQFHRWNKAEGKVLPGLVRRRKAEADLYVKTVVEKALPKPDAVVEKELSWFEKIFKKFLDYLFGAGNSEVPATVPTEDALDAKILALNPQIPALALKKALEYKDHPAVTNKDLLIVVDFSASEKKKRFHMIDLQTLKAESYKVAHGANSDPDKDGVPTKFSNIDGSHESSLGPIVVKEAYASAKFKYARRLDGLVKGLNDHVRSRAIVWHSSTYVNDVEGQAIGDSWGCFAMSEATSGKIKDKIGGCLLYAWHDSLKG